MQAKPPAKTLRPSRSRPKPGRKAARSVSAAPAPATSEKLQRFLARAGLGSRREIETWIAAGRVTVDGRPATIGLRVTGVERVALDGRELPRHAGTSTLKAIVYHKPDGEVTTRSDPEGRPTVFDNLPRLRGSRWISVGRLDFNTSGLLIFTTDGELAHRLMHPSSEVEREYAVRVLGPVRPEALAQLREGVTLDDGPMRFVSVENAGGEGANHWYRVVLKEGRNREVRRAFEAVGATVSRLMRVRYGPVGLPRTVRAGRFQDLEGEELEALYAAVGMTGPTHRLGAKPPPIKMGRASSAERHPPGAQKHVRENRRTPRHPGRTRTS